MAIPCAVLLYLCMSIDRQYRLDVQRCFTNICRSIGYDPQTCENTYIQKCRKYADITRDFIVYSLRNASIEYLDTGKLECKKKVYELTYFDGPNRYSLVFSNKRGPCPFYKVCDATLCDVTETVRMYAGPCHNFHGIPTTPQMLGFSSLLFYFRDQRIFSYEGSEPITFESSTQKTSLFTEI